MKNTLKHLLLEPPLLPLTNIDIIFFTQLSSLVSVVVLPYLVGKDCIYITTRQEMASIRPGLECAPSIVLYPPYQLVGQISSYKGLIPGSGQSQANEIAWRMGLQREESQIEASALLAGRYGTHTYKPHSETLNKKHKKTQCRSPGPRIPPDCY